MLALNALSRLVGDEIENVTEMHPHLIRRDADDSNALGRKPPRASRIVLATTLVAFAIHFDRQHRLCAIEVQHIDADRMLAAELRPPSARRRRWTQSRASGGVRARRRMRARETEPSFVKNPSTASPSPSPFHGEETRTSRLCTLAVKETARPVTDCYIRHGQAGSSALDRAACASGANPPDDPKSSGTAR